MNTIICFHVLNLNYIMFAVFMSVSASALPIENGNETWNSNFQCETNDYCRPSKTLMVCGSQKKCICKDSYKFYDKAIGFCAIKVGTPCQVSHSENEDEKEKDQCVWNAVCNPISKICECRGSNFTESDGKCLLNYWMPCDSLRACNPNKFLVCRENQVSKKSVLNISTATCDCRNPSSLAYSEKEGLCLAKPGEMCEKIPFGFGMEPYCGAHATCEYQNSPYSHFGICRCNQGYSPIGENHTDCGPSYGTFCNSTELCAPNRHLRCVTLPNLNFDDQGQEGDISVCKCEPNSNIVIVGGIPEHCALLEGAGCKIDYSICTENAHCNTSTLTCECKFGYSRTPMRTCKSDFRSLCSSENDNCNNSTGLVCIKNKCKCSINQVFDSTLRPPKCVIPIGGSCDTQTALDFQICSNHAFCELGSNKCTCLKPMMPKSWKSDGLCYSGFGAPCNYSSNNINDLNIQQNFCLGGHFLTCGRNSTCECNKHSLPEIEVNGDSHSIKCFLKFGEKCNGNRNEACVHHAICDDDSVGDMSCQCTSGARLTKDGRCGLLHGHLCEPSKNECNSDVFLTCVQQKIHNHNEFKCDCSLASGLIYDLSRKSCTSLSRFKCDRKYGPFCVKNAECIFGICQCVQNFKENFTNHFCVKETVNNLSQYHYIISTPSNSESGSESLSNSVSAIPNKIKLKITQQLLFIYWGYSRFLLCLF